MGCNAALIFLSLNIEGINGVGGKESERERDTQGTRAMTGKISGTKCHTSFVILSVPSIPLVG